MKPVPAKIQPAKFESPVASVATSKPIPGKIQPPKFEATPTKTVVKPAPQKSVNWMRKNSDSDEEKKPVPKPVPKKIDHGALEAAMKM